MTDKQKERIEKLGLKAEDFAPKKNETTIDDLVEAIGILTGIICGEE